MENKNYPFINLPLPYEYGALEPFIDEKTMYLHHEKHLQTYIDKLNAVLSDHPNLQKMTLEQLIRIAGKLPDKLQVSIRNYAGGVFNHRFFFSGMTSLIDQEPKGRLAKAIDRQFGSIDMFKTALKKAALSVFGSGYAWLVRDRCGLKIVPSPNQNCPLEQNLDPILAVDVWEHAYYLKHYNLRADYIDDWMRVINWDQAEENYLLSLSSSCGISKKARSLW